MFSVIRNLKYYVEYYELFEKMLSKSGKMNKVTKNAIFSGKPDFDFVS